MFHEVVVEGDYVYFHLSGSDEVKRHGKNFVYSVLDYMANGYSLSTTPEAIQDGVRMLESLGVDTCNDLYDYLNLQRKQRLYTVPALAEKATRGWEVKNPVTLEDDELYSVIIYLNDSAGWTREQIADWLDTLPEQPKWSLIDVEKQKLNRITF
jgi:hypothetical protein